MKAQTLFTISSWNETPYSEIDNAGKLTRASVIKKYKGDLQGEGILEYIMAYQQDGSALFSGFERVTGTIGEHSGSFVLQHNGSFKDGTMHQISTVLENSATGTLSGLKGECELTATHQGEYPFTFNYSFT